MGDTAHLGHVLRAVREIDGVFDVYRVTGVRPDAAPVPSGRAELNAKA